MALILVISHALFVLRWLALASVVVAREPVTPSLTPIEKDGKVVGFKRRTLHKVFNYGTVAAVACVS